MFDLIFGHAAQLITQCNDVSLFLLFLHLAIITILFLRCDFYIILYYFHTVLIETEKLVLWVTHSYNES